MMARRRPAPIRNDDEMSSSSGDDGASGGESDGASSSSVSTSASEGVIGAADEEERRRAAAGDGESGSSSSSSDDDDDDDDADNDEEREDRGAVQTAESMKAETGEGSSSDGGEDTDDDDDDDDDDDGAAPGADASSPPPISKSWAALTAHSPCYTGGTVAFSHSPSVLIASASGAGGQSSSSTPSSHRFVLAQRGGDVSVIEASTGLLLRTVRKGRSFRGGHDLSSGYDGNDEDEDDDDDDDDEETMDAEAITAFALSPNNLDMVAVTRSHLVRRYSLAVPDGGDADKKNGDEKKKAPRNKDGKGDDGKRTAPQSVTSITDPAKVSYSFGKSGHSLPVTKVAFHPSGVFFATGSVDGLVKVWDARNGYATHALHPTSGGGGGGSSRGRYAVTCIEWRPAPASLVLAIGREDGSISIHDLLLNANDSKSASMPVAVLRDHLSAVTCMAWSSDAGAGAATTSSVGGARKHGAGVFFSSGRDSVINTWLITEEEVEEEDAPKRKKKKKSSGDDGSGVRSGGGPAVKVSYRRIHTLPVYEQVEGMVLVPRRFRAAESIDRRDVVLATCGTKGAVRLWRASPGDRTDGNGMQSAISPLSLFAAQSDKDAFGEENGGYTSLHLVADPSAMLAAVDAEHNMTFLRANWSTTAAFEGDGSIGLETDRAIVGHNGEILDLAVVPPHVSSHDGDGSAGGGDEDEHTVAVATNSSQVRIFGLRQSEGGGSAVEGGGDETQENHSALSPRSVLDGHAAIVLSVDASPCGRYLATSSKDKTARLWHVPTSRCLAVATGHTEAIGSVSLSRRAGRYDVGGKSAEGGAGAFVVTASKDRTLKVWSLPGSAVLGRWAEDGGRVKALNARLNARAHEKDINIVSVAPNDGLIATGSQDKQVKLWRSADLALHGTLKGHKRGVWDCQFAPHDRIVATASGDRTIKLWSISDCKCVRTFQGHMAGVLRVRFLGSGLQLLSSGSDGLIKLWTIRTNECENTMDGHDDKIWALDLSPCGTALFSGGADSKIAVWKDTTKERDIAAREAEEQNVMMEQRLSNHLRHKQYEQALEIALDLEKPNQVLRVLTEITEKDTKNGKGVETLQKHVAKWSPDRLKQMLKYCREWNTRARNSHIAMLVVKAVVTTIPAAKLATSYDGVPEILSGIAPYAERHFDRLDRMVGDSYLLDFTMFSIGSLHGSNNEGYDEWASRSKYVLPPKEADGRIQIGGSLVIGGGKARRDDSESSDDDVLTIGDSDSDGE